MPTKTKHEKSTQLKFPAEIIYLKLVLHIVLLKEYDYDIQNLADGDLDYIPFDISERLQIMNFNPLDNE